MKNELLKVSIRQKAVYTAAADFATRSNATRSGELQPTTATLVAKAAKLGFGFSEELLRALNPLNIAEKSQLLKLLGEIKGTHKGWTPLIKAWDIPTGESFISHLITYFTNKIGDQMADE